MHSGSNEAYILSCNSDDGSKYSASEERTFSRTCKSRVLCRYLVSPVSFSHNNVRLLMVYSQTLYRLNLGNGKSHGKQTFRKDDKP